MAEGGGVKTHIHQKCLTPSFFTLALHSTVTKCLSPQKLSGKTGPLEEQLRKYGADLAMLKGASNEQVSKDDTDLAK